MASITMPVAIAGSAALSAGAGLYGASMQSSAAQNAAQLQASSADKALALQKAMFGITQNNLMPFISTGQNAMTALNQMTGVGGSNDLQILQLQRQLSQLGYQAPSTAGQNNIGAMTPGMIAAQAAGPHSGGLGTDNLLWGISDPFSKGASPLQDIYAAMQKGLPISDSSWKEAGYGPNGAALGGQASGTAMSGSSGASNPNQAQIDQILGQIQQLQSSNVGGNPLTAPLTAKFNPTMAQLEATPGYQFARDQGLRAMTNQLGSQGLTGSGGMVAGLGQYATGLASQTYNQQFQNYWAQNQSIYNMLSGLAAMGGNAAAMQGTNATNAGNSMAGLITGAGTALASGQIGSANALAGGAGNVAGSLGNAGLMYSMFQNNGLFGQQQFPNSVNVTPGLFPSGASNTGWAGPDTAIGYGGNVA